MIFSPLEQRIKSLYKDYLGIDYSEVWFLVLKFYWYFTIWIAVVVVYVHGMTSKFALGDIYIYIYIYIYI